MNRRRPWIIAGFAAMWTFGNTAWAATWFVKPGGTGDGSSWPDAASISNAVASAAAGDAIWMQSGTYALAFASASANAISILGGFAGTETDPGERTGTGHAVLDGTAIATCLSLTAASGTLVIENLVFSNAVTRGLNKTGGASLVARNCRFANNGPTASANGRGAYLSGGASATLTLTNCVFAGNVDKTMGSLNLTSGVGAYVTTFQRVEMTDCLFFENGIYKTTRNPPGREQGNGWALYLNAAPIVANRVRFVGNRAVSHSTHGAILWINGNCGGSVFSNCQWVANSHIPFSYASLGSQRGAIYVAMDTSSRTLRLENCTLAYNLGSYCYCPGLTVNKGAVTVRNSIFFGNIMYYIFGMASEIYVENTNGSVDIDHSLLPGEGHPYVSGPGALTIGAHMIYVDPLFATATNAFLENISGSSTIAIPASGGMFYFKDSADLAAIDVHLRSQAGRWNGTTWVTADTVVSPAIDAGDPSGPFTNEPAPNGFTLNLGCYGNTAEASKTSEAVPEIASVVVSQTNDYTRPCFIVTMGGTTAYCARVRLYYGTTEGEGSEGWDSSILMPEGFGPGDAFTIGTREYFNNGVTIYWRLVASSAYGSDAESGSLVISGTMPPNWGSGGGADVIHVMGAARGVGTGDNWLDAVTDWKAAADLVTETRTNIWVAGTVPSRDNSVIISRSVVIRGGFTGFENTAGNRPAGTYSTVDGARRCQAIRIAAASGTSLLERIEIAHATGPALEKTGEGCLALVNCRIVDNGWESGNWGSGVKATGAAGSSTLFATNCYFERRGGAEGERQNF